ncbi:GGDEF domain-containing protein [Proteinivorax hydrogeniformans]|uniref:GGDEF domain-containing protein n=1 Tax=Proteinivorax hydrogeniformans TaxID=1826727 RepID=A0AAU8HUJ3_9FIRM
MKKLRLKNYKHQDILFEYLDELSRLAVVLVDRQLIIQDCNQGFLKMVNQVVKPIGQEFQSFLKQKIPTEKLPIKGRKEQIKRETKVAENLFIFFSWTILHLEEGYLMVGEKLPLYSSDITEKMATINDELTNLTRELTKKTIELEKTNATIKELSNTDGLTGAFNRRYINEMLPALAETSKEVAKPLSIIMADIDTFKKINDSYGHCVGDDVLKDFVKILKGRSRNKDLVARYGGEEFLLVLPDTAEEEAGKIAERMREELQNFQFDKLSEVVTASFGVAELMAKEKTENFIKRADDAMYKAKMEGRNKVVVS